MKSYIDLKTGLVVSILIIILIMASWFAGFKTGREFESDFLPHYKITIDNPP